MVRKTPDDSSSGVAGPRYPVESVAKAAELLRLFGHHSELRLSDVGQTIGVSASTAHRLLTTLEASVEHVISRALEQRPDLSAKVATLRAREAHVHQVQKEYGQSCP